MKTDSYNISMSFKLNESMLKQLMILCEYEGQSYSGAVRAGLSLLFAKRFKGDTRNTNQTMVRPW